MPDKTLETLEIIEKHLRDIADALNGIAEFLIHKSTLTK